MTLICQKFVSKYRFHAEYLCNHEYVCHAEYLCNNQWSSNAEYLCIFVNMCAMLNICAIMNSPVMLNICVFEALPFCWSVGQVSKGRREMEQTCWKATWSFMLQRKLRIHAAEKIENLCCRENWEFMLQRKLRIHAAKQLKSSQLIRCFKATRPKVRARWFQEQVTSHRSKVLDPD